MSVGVTLTEDRNEAKDHARKTVRVRVSANHSLGGKLRRPVEGSLKGKRRLLGRRKDVWLAVHRAGGRKGDSACSHSAHCFEDGRGSDRVLFEVTPRVVGSATNVRVRLQVKDPVASRYGLLQQRLVQHVSLNKPRAWPFEELGDEFVPAGTEIINHHNLHTVGAQTIGKGAADESGSTGDAHPSHALRG